MDVRGWETGSAEWITPGTLVGSRFRVASVVTRRGVPARELVCAALDEQTRRRVRLRFAPGRPDLRMTHLVHPCVPETVATGPARVDGVSWVATAWFDGDPLSIPDQPLSDDLRAVRRWAAALSDALEVLDLVHRALGRAHGGLGPWSLWLADDGRLRFVDLPAPEAGCPPELVPFAPPELEDGPSTDPRTDLYAVAALFYALATGRAPFGAELAVAALGHRESRLPDHPALPGPVLSVLRTAMEKRVHHRFASALRFRTALGNALAEVEAAHGRPEAPSLAPETIPAVPFHPDRSLPPDTDGTLAPTAGRTEVPGRPPLGRLVLACAVGLVASLVAWLGLVALLASFLGT